MNIKIIVILTAILLSIVAPSQAENLHAHSHGGEIFHMFRLEADIGAGQDELKAGWDFDGWVGTDEHKLWLKSEAEIEDGTTEQAEIWTLYSRNIATYWDAQIGLRYDHQPESTTYLAAGLNGLAQYFFETEAHLFISDEGDLSLRFHQETEFFLTQRSIIQPYLEANLFAQDVDEQDIGAGLASAEFGLQLRYEISRKFAPYINLRYESLFGETSSIAKREGDDNDDLVISAGLRLMF